MSLYSFDLENFLSHKIVAPANPDRYITIAWFSGADTGSNPQGIRIRIMAKDANEMTAKIFVYQVRPKNPNTGLYVGEFDHVGSPSDIEETPEDQPHTSHRPAWFRLDYVDLLVRSRSEAYDLLRSIIDDVYGLKHAYDAMDVLQPHGEQQIGNGPPATPSSSSSSSSG